MRGCDVDARASAEPESRGAAGRHDAEDTTGEGKTGTSGTHPATSGTALVAYEDVPDALAEVLLYLLRRRMARMSTRQLAPESEVGDTSAQR